MFKEKDLVKLKKQADQGLKEFHQTENGKAFFKLMKALHIDPSCMSDNASNLIANVTRKEFVEDMYRAATGQSIIDAKELENE